MQTALTFTEALAAGQDVIEIVAAIITLTLRLTWLVILPVLGIAWLAGWLK